MVGAVAGCFALASGAIIANGREFSAAVPFWVAFVAVTGLSVAVAGRTLVMCRASIRSGQGLTSLGSGTVALVMLVAVSLSGWQLADGGRLSKLDELGFPEVAPRNDVTADFVIFVLALVALVAGEWLAQQVVARKQQSSRGARTAVAARPRFESKGVYLTLVGLAVVSFALQHGQSQQDAFSVRGQVTGEGAKALLGYSAPLAVVVGIISSHWGSRRLLAVSLVLVSATLVMGGTRTPLVIVGVGLLVRLVVRLGGARKPLAAGVAIVALGYVALVLIVAISEWRGSVAIGQPVSLTSTIVSSATDPISHLSAGGLDTIDGLSLATKVDRARVGATVLDPLKAVISFVPRQLWPSKPAFLGNTVSHTYTDFGGNAGIFLSGPGYGLIVFGGRVAMMTMFLVIGFVCEALYRRQARITVWTVMITYFLMRFMVAGDAFDLFHVLGLCLVYCFAYGVYFVWWRERSAQSPAMAAVGLSRG